VFGFLSDYDKQSDKGDQVGGQKENKVRYINDATKGGRNRVHEHNLCFLLFNSGNRLGHWQ